MDTNEPGDQPSGNSPNLGAVSIYDTPDRFGQPESGTPRSMAFSSGRRGSYSLTMLDPRTQHFFCEISPVDANGNPLGLTKDNMELVCSYIRAERFADDPIRKDVETLFQRFLSTLQGNTLQCPGVHKYNASLIDGPGKCPDVRVRCVCNIADSFGRNPHAMDFAVSTAYKGVSGSMREFLLKHAPFTVSGSSFREQKSDKYRTENVSPTGLAVLHHPESLEVNFPVGLWRNNLDFLVTCINAGKVRALAEFLYQCLCGTSTGRRVICQAEHGHVASLVDTAPGKCPDFRMDVMCSLAGNDAHIPPYVQVSIRFSGTAVPLRYAIREYARFTRSDVSAGVVDARFMPFAAPVQRALPAVPLFRSTGDREAKQAQSASARETQGHVVVPIQPSDTSPAPGCAASRIPQSALDEWNVSTIAPGKLYPPLLSARAIRELTGIIGRRPREPLVWSLFKIVSETWTGWHVDCSHSGSVSAVYTDAGPLRRAKLVLTATYGETLVRETHHPYSVSREVFYWIPPITDAILIILGVSGITKATLSEWAEEEDKKRAAEPGP